MNCIRLNAGNDRNGNPRRVYVILDQDNGIKAVYDEGYRGYDAVPDIYRKIAQTAPTFATTPREYREILKQFKEQ
jgi:hypothetical protein